MQDMQRDTNSGNKNKSPRVQSGMEVSGLHWELYQSTAKQAVLTASCVLHGARIQGLCESLFADNEETKSAVRGIQVAKKSI